MNAALDVAESLLAELTAMKQVRRAAFAGSLRRMRETIGDVDLLVASDSAAPIMDAFVGLPSASRVIAHGDTKSSILTDHGLQVDLRVVPKEVWGAAMIYFTGSKAHNVRIREMAVRAGLKLNEYGLFDAKTGDLLAAETEAAGLRASRAAVHRADAPGGSRRGRGRARRRAARRSCSSRTSGATSTPTRT